MHQEEMERLAAKAVDDLAARIPGTPVVMVVISEPTEPVRYGFALRGNRVQALGTLAMVQHKLEEMILG